MAKITQLKKGDENVYPLVHMDGVVDDNGNSISTMWDTKQDKLVSGASLKTVNGTSLLGSGDITIEGGANVPFIRGTQTGNTGSWTGVAPFSTLTDGQEIVYCLPYAGNGNATLNLTLSNNTTTGAKNVYWRGTTQCTTHNPAGSVFRLIYKENFAPSGATTGTKYTGWWQIGDSYYSDNNTINGRHTGASIYKTGSVLVPSQGLCMMNDSGRLEGLVTTAGNGTSKTKNSNGLVLGQMFFSGSTVQANTNVGSNVIYSEYTYGTIDFRYSSNCGTTLTAQKPVYIVGTVDEYDGLFYLDNTWWTQTLPTSENGKVYIYVGTAISTSGIVGFTGGHLVYHYKDDGFRLYSYESHTKYIPQISTTIVSMKPNTVYCVRSGSGTTWNAITTLSISALNTTGYGVQTNTSGSSFPQDNSKVPIYCACFIAGANISISLPSSVKWVNGVMPTIESGEFCELVIMNNIATINKAQF